jgi:hypothetical protein
MKFSKITLLVCLLITNHLLNAQVREIPLNDLSMFQKTTTKWSIVGKVNGSPFDKNLTGEKGTGVLLNTHNGEPYNVKDNIYTTLEHGDIHLQLDFMMPKGSNSGVYLMGRYEVQLYESWGVKKPKYIDCGGIYERWDESRPEGKKGYEGHAPRQNASLAPGLWQHLDIEFEAPRFDAAGKKIKNARFLKVTLNNQVIHENIEVTGPTRAAGFDDEKARGPIMIQGDHGTIAFKNMKYDITEEGKPLVIKDLMCEYWEGAHGDAKELMDKKPTRISKADKIDARLADLKTNFALRFKGTLQIEKAGEYQFMMGTSGALTMTIDTSKVIKGWWWRPDDTQTATKYLTAGSHPIEIVYARNHNWGFGKALGLSVRPPFQRVQVLNALASMPAPEAVGLYEVKAESEPVLQRSFVYYNGKKRTHAINVGTADKIHFSYDLNQMCLLQAWKGRFLNTTEMWHERGEPQVASPMGVAVQVGGFSHWGKMGTPLKDSLDVEKELLYKGYSFDEKRNPIFKYKLNGVEITDAIVPNAEGTGIKRQILTDINDGSLVFRFAKSKNIEKIAEGLYYTDGQYIKTAMPNLQILEIGEFKHLVYKPGVEKSAIDYEILW